MSDIFSKIDRAMQRDLGQYARIGHGYTTFPKLTGPIGPKMNFRGNEVLVWSLNNYLGLANHPEVRKADAEAAAEYGFAYPMGSRMLTGNSDYHEQFERMAADFMEKEDAFLVNFGYQACASAIEALTDRRDVIVYDQLSHACIIDGMNQSLAKRFVFRHNDIEQLEDRLQKAQRITAQTGGGILVVTEGVFGMKGDMGRLDEIVKLKQKYDFSIFIDDAHGFGIMGAKGQGVAEHYGVQKDIDVIFCTFAKSMAMIGAFIAADAKVINFLRYNMRSQIYAKALPLALTIGAIKRLELLRDRHELRQQLWDVTNAIQNGLKERGFEVGDGGTPVTPVHFRGGLGEMVQVIRDIRENYKVFMSGVTYPVIERGELILRIIPTAAHNLAHVDYTLDVFTQVREKLQRKEYADVFPQLA